MSSGLKKKKITYLPDHCCWAEQACGRTALQLFCKVCASAHGNSAFIPLEYATLQYSTGLRKWDLDKPVPWQQRRHSEHPAQVCECLASVPVSESVRRLWEWIGLLPSILEPQTVLLAPGFSLTWSWLLWAFVDRSSHSLFFSPILFQISVFQVNMTKVLKSFKIRHQTQKFSAGITKKWQWPMPWHSKLILCL